MKNMWKFAPYSDYTQEQAEKCSIAQLLKRVQNGDDIPLEDFKSHFSQLWHYDSYKSGVVRFMGWIFDFSPYFNAYLVKKFNESCWHEFRAPSVKYIYELATSPDDIERVIELPDENAAA